MRWLLLLLIGCGGARGGGGESGGGESGGGESGELEWLGGVWRVGEGPGGAFELWGEDERGWLGLSVEVDPQGSASEPELMWIEPDAASLVALPGGRRTRFRRSASTEGSVRFEAPEHDSPKWIRYRRDGAALEAAIGDGAEPTAEWRFEAVPGAPLVRRGPYEVCRAGDLMTVSRGGCQCGATLTCGVVDDPLPLRVAILDHSCDSCEPVSGECPYDAAIDLADGECAEREAVTLLHVDLR